MTALKFISTLDRFYTTPITQGGFLRFLTRPWKDEQKRAQPPRMSIAKAFETLREVTQWPPHGFLPDDEPFTGVSLRSMSGHRQWTDAYLLRLARKHKVKLATPERKMDNMMKPVRPCFSLCPEVSSRSLVTSTATSGGCGADGFQISDFRWRETRRGRNGAPDNNGAELGNYRATEKCVAPGAALR